MPEPVPEDQSAEAWLVVCRSNAQRWPAAFLFLCYFVAAGMISTLGNSTQMAVSSAVPSQQQKASVKPSAENVL